jgi:hypothetical protein
LFVIVTITKTEAPTFHTGLPGCVAFCEGAIEMANINFASSCANAVATIVAKQNEDRCDWTQRKST